LKGDLKKPLGDIRIADFTWWQSGPQATQYLASMGAEIIKIESKKRPDALRRLGDGIPFLALNRGKMSCTLDLTRSRARALVKKLIGASDAVVENFGGGVMERLGLDYNNLKKVKPNIVMLSISGLGRTGPEKNNIAYAQNAHAYSGLSSLTGYVNGPPVSAGAFWGDQTAALAGAFSLLTALHYLKKTGRGQYIDLSMSEVLSSMIPEDIMDYTINTRVQRPKGNRNNAIAPHGCFRCRGKDEWVAIAVSNDEEWKGLCKVMNKMEWTREKRFSDNESRLRNQDELESLINKWTIKHGAGEAMEILQKAGVASGPSLKTDELASDPQLGERKFFLEGDQKEKGVHQSTRMPWICSSIPNTISQPPPQPGEHNDYVFGDILGLEQKEIKQLIKEGIIY